MDKKIFLFFLFFLAVVVNFSIASAAIDCAKVSNYNLTRQVYIVPYVGDIDGHIAPVRFHFFQELVDFHNSNQIPVGMSFYPGTLDNHPDPLFKKSFISMYRSPYVELIQKGYAGSDEEAKMTTLSPERQKEIIMLGQDTFREKMSAWLGTEKDQIIMTKSYNQFQGYFDQRTMAAAESLGFNQYFDVFYPGDTRPLKSTGTFNVIQYGISYSDDGKAGSQDVFQAPASILCEIDNYQRADLEIVEIRGRPVIPLWTHQQDFEDESSPPDYINHMKWKMYQQTLLELKSNPNVEFLLPSEVYEKIYGKQGNPENSTNENRTEEICITPVASDEKTKVEKDGKLRMCESFDFYLPGFDNVSVPKKCESFLWSILTALGFKNLDPKTDKSISLFYERPVYNPSIQAPANSLVNADEVWAENRATGKSARVKMPSNASSINLDSGMYIDKINLKFSDNSSADFNNLKLCGKKFASLSDMENVEICTWKGCRKGAVSVTVDDKATACMENLEKNNYRGTYYLSHTNEYNQTEWDMYRKMFAAGHEIGTHSQQHRCIYNGERAYKKDIQNNINDILKNTNISRNDLISHAYPCGYSSERDLKVIESLGYLSARGYNINNFEGQTPENFFYLNSFNEIEFPGGELNPRDYYYLINETEKNGRWTILSFHNDYCSDMGVIDYLPSKNLWVDTVGNIVKYIDLRNNAKIENYRFENNTISFDIHTDGKFQDGKYRQNLTLSAGIGQRKVKSIIIDEKTVPYEWNKYGGEYYAQFDVPFPADRHVQIKLEN